MFVLYLLTIITVKIRFIDGIISTSGPYFIQNLQTCCVLDIEHPVNVIGSKVIATKLKNSICQMWDIYDIGTGYMIANRYNGMVMDIANGGKESGNHVILWGPTHKCNQRWTFEKDLDGKWMKIKSGVSNYVLDVVASDVDKISYVVAFPQHDGRNQKFKLIPVGNTVPRQPECNTF